MMSEWRTRKTSSPDWFDKRGAALSEIDRPFGNLWVTISALCSNHAVDILHGSIAMESQSEAYETAQGSKHVWNQIISDSSCGIAFRDHCISRPFQICHVNYHEPTHRNWHQWWRGGRLRADRNVERRDFSICAILHLGTFMQYLRMARHQNMCCFFFIFWNLALAGI